MRRPALVSAVLLCLGCGHAAADKGGGHNIGGGGNSGNGSRLVGSSGPGPIQALEDHARVIKSENAAGALASPGGAGIEFQAQMPQDRGPGKGSGRSGHDDESAGLDRHRGRELTERFGDSGRLTEPGDATARDRASAALVSQLFAPWTTVPAKGDKQQEGTPSSCGPAR